MVATLAAAKIIGDGGQAVGVAVSVTDEGSLATLVDTAVAELDILSLRRKWMRRSSTWTRLPI